MKKQPLSPSARKRAQRARQTAWLRKRNFPSAEALVSALMRGELEISRPLKARMVPTQRESEGTK